MEVRAATGGEEVEEDVFGAGGVVEDGENSGERAPEVGGIESHCDVDDGRWGFVGGAVNAIAIGRGFAEGGERGDEREEEGGCEEAEDEEQGEGHGGGGWGR